MKQNKTLLFTRLAVTVILIFSFCGNALAIIEFYDGKLKLDGFVKESIFYRTQMKSEDKKFHDNSVDYDVTAGLFEALYTFKEDDAFTLRGFAGLKYWWEKATMFDDKLDRYIPRRDKRDYERPRDFDDDILTEAYIDYINGPLQIKVGKQIVIWGQLDIQRVADVVNPIDLRKGSPGIDTWEEVKRGLWMIRTLYKTQLPGDLQFEGIFNPGDYRGIEIPYEGTHYGGEHAATNPFTPGPDFGILSWQSQKWRRDAPGWNLKDNYEFGFRTTGFTWDIDWTLLYWNARDDGPCMDPRQITPYTLQYITAGIKSSMLGRSFNPPDISDYKKRVYAYKRYSTLGGTAQTVIKPLWDTVWRFEWYYERNRPMNFGTDGNKSATYGWTRRNILGGAVQCSKYLKIPWFTESFLANNALTSVSLTYFYEKIFNFKNDLVVDDRNHKAGASSTDQLILFVQQDIMSGTFMFVFTGNYYLRIKKWMAVPSISYVMPGKHWRLDVGYVAYGVGRYDYIGRTTDSKDSIFTRLRYEF
ncbi:MAG: DUF1302 family protein [Pseudomonadota bacterium]